MNDQTESTTGRDVHWVIHNTSKLCASILIQTRNNEWGIDIRGGIVRKPYPPSLKGLNGSILCVGNVKRINKLHLLWGQAGHSPGLHVMLVVIAGRSRSRDRRCIHEGIATSHLYGYKSMLQIERERWHRRLNGATASSKNKENERRKQQGASRIRAFERAQ